MQKSGAKSFAQAANPNGKDSTQTPKPEQPRVSHVSPGVAKQQQLPAARGRRLTSMKKPETNARAEVAKSQMKETPSTKVIATDANRLLASPKDSIAEIPQPNKQLRVTSVRHGFSQQQQQQRTPGGQRLTHMNTGTTSLAEVMSRRDKTNQRSETKKHKLPPNLKDRKLGYDVSERGQMPRPKNNTIFL